MECSFKASGLLSFFLIFIFFLMNFDKIITSRCKIMQRCYWQIAIHMSPHWLSTKVLPSHVSLHWLSTKESHNSGSDCPTTSLKWLKKKKKMLYKNLLHDIWIQWSPERTKHFIWCLSLRNQNIFGNSICWKCNHSTRRKIKIQIYLLLNQNLNTWVELKPRVK